ncbi:Sn1-specific diacylglycerol lipase alpha [Camellia lanceoleosa]|uniref:Sn1-specific diacylglycerol lipase alpha n=1 Tax=Camellia lanceoleosa TaxID=1840588 RepID=A0ACC0FPX6_9ERIC|nr:Sn1-specific diacylglycerol lipase alpha [Camellia lanceoleosa]
MMKQSLKFFFPIMNSTMKLFKKEVSCQRIVYNVLNRYQSQWSNGEKVENNVSKEAKKASQVSVTPKVDKNVNDDSQIWKYSPNNDDGLSDSKWKLELAWFTKALETALQLYRRAMPTGNGFGNKSPTSSRSLMEIVASLQRSKIGLQDWSLSDLTIGLFLIYLKQASETPFEDVKGIQISSDSIVHDLIYHLELAKGAYRDNTAGLARNSMLRESNVVKFIKDSSIMRPGYYIGIDARKRLVILGIRGTQTVYDLITDIATSSTEEVTFEGYSTHFGTAEAARWFLSHEMGTIKKCLEKHEGFRLRLVGHSLGGATASLLAIMLRRKSSKELGFSPDIVTAIGYATPPCVSRELAECCSDYVTTVVMQDDIIPRLSVASLTRLRNEILQTDWMSALEKEDWRNVIGLVSNAKNVVSSVHDVARKLADYAKFGGQTKVSGVSSTSKAARESAVLGKKDSAMPEEELFVPGTLYYLKRNIVDNRSSSNEKGRKFFTLWRRHPGEHFQRILLSNNLISDHKCDSYYYALRDVLKGFPGPIEETIFKHK